MIKNLSKPNFKDREERLSNSGIYINTTASFNPVNTFSAVSTPSNLKSRESFGRENNMTLGGKNNTKPNTYN